MSFFLTIPCQPGKPDKIYPILVFTGKDNTGAATVEYRCPFCEDRFSNRKSCARHMGIGAMFSNIKDVGCRILRELGSEREGYVYGHFKKVKNEIQKRYGKSDFPGRIPSRMGRRAKPKRNKKSTSSRKNQ
jgi:hypothetical protein